MMTLTFNPNTKSYWNKERTHELRINFEHEAGDFTVSSAKGRYIGYQSPKGLPTGYFKTSNVTVRVSFSKDGKIRLYWD